MLEWPFMQIQSRACRARTREIITLNARPLSLSLTANFSTTTTTATVCIRVCVTHQRVIKPRAVYCTDAMASVISPMEYFSRLRTFLSRSHYFYPKRESCVCVYARVEKFAR